MQAGDSDVVQAADVVAHQLGRPRRLLGDRYVGGPGGGDDDRAVTWRYILLTKCDDGRIGIIRGAGDLLAHRGVGVLGRARYQQRRTAIHDLRGDGGDLGRRFA